MQERCTVWKDAINHATLKDIDVKQISETKISIQTTLALPTVEGEIDLAYTVVGNGQLDVSYKFEAKKANLPEIPRIGMEFRMPKAFDNLKYYGRGPWENYSDRKTAAFVGLYQSKVSEQYFPYGRPQENGHKTDVRWLSLTNQTGLGIRVVAHNEPLEFNALHNSVDDFDSGKKKQLLTPNDVAERNFVEVHIDHKMMGVGGDNSWGAKPHKPYMYYSDKPYQYSFSIILLKRQEFLTSYSSIQHLLVGATTLKSAPGEHQPIDLPIHRVRPFDLACALPARILAPTNQPIRCASIKSVGKSVNSP